ncbi:transcription antitermination factor NusB [Breoghania sp.]|uniref:RsmB/NOP family class I SAM-dependent RNA methyltransferase n=1 Tax=Breoghania sp. TaxID=2065378 RepID=UPI0032047975
MSGRNGRTTNNSGNGARPNRNARAENKNSSSGKPKQARHSGKTGDRKTGAPQGRPARKPVPGLATRRAAVDILGKVVHSRRMLAAEFDTEHGNNFYRELAANDRALVRAIVGVALHHRGQIAEMLTRLLDRPIPEKTDRVEDILHVAIVEILFLDVAGHAAVSLAVDEASAERKAQPYKGLINAVLHRLIREREAFLAPQDAVRLNALDWLFARWSAAYGEETARAIAAAHMAEPGLDITLKPAEDAAAWAEKLGATVLPTGSLRIAEAGRVEDLAGFETGAWWVQDAAAALPTQLLGDVAGLNVADLCATPGGKTAQLAAAGAKVTAVDISPNRLKRVSQNMERLGLSMEVRTADLGVWEQGETFDSILLDAPCSATGTARCHPDMPWSEREADIVTLSEIQARFLRRALGWLKPGGVMVYCTCSLEPEGGERQIEALLTDVPSVERVPIAADEITELDGLVTPAGDLRTLPCH